MVLVDLRRSAALVPVLAGIAVASLWGCSDTGGFNRLDGGGIPLAGRDGGPDRNQPDANQVGTGGGRPPGTGGAPVGSGGMGFGTGGKGSGGTGGGSGGMNATGGGNATGGSPASGGMTASGGTTGGGGRSGAGGATPTGGAAGSSATGGGGGASAGGAGGPGGQTAAMGGSTGTRPCDGLCLNPISVPPGKISGNLGTGATCHEVLPTVATPISGLNCGNFVAPRAFSINAMSVSCAAPNSQNFPLPVERNGGYCMQASPGNQSFAYFITF